MMTFDAKKAWKRVYRELRLVGLSDDAGGRRHWGILMRCSGAKGKYPNGPEGHFCYMVQAMLQRNDKADRNPDRYERTRTVLNGFGRLNPWKCFTPSAARHRDQSRRRALRAKLLAKRMIAPEPGGYVTGLLSHAPAKMWWVDYPSPVAAPSQSDVDLYEGRRLAA